MGESKRRAAHDTLDGGPLSDDQIMLQVEAFDPMQPLDALRGKAAREVLKRLFSSRTPICGACDYEFGYGERPLALYCTRPMFPKAEAFVFVCGAICPQCAVRPHDELMVAITSYLHAIKPDITIVQSGTA